MTAYHTGRELLSEGNIVLPATWTNSLQKLLEGTQVNVYPP